MPSTELLDRALDDGSSLSESELNQIAQLLETKLEEFGIEATVESVLPGPVVTRFEIQPAPGTKASKITGIAQDIARSLSVSSVRVVEVIEGKSFVVGCTTNPGDCDEFQKALGIDVYYNPEFIAQGSIIKDLQNADMVLLGGKGKHTEVLEHLYYTIQLGYKDAKVHTMSAKAAELTKIAVNCFLTTKISYANMIGEVLALSKLDDEIDTVLNAIGSDSRVGTKYLNFGFGFGGPCFPRDNRAFAAHAKSVGVQHNIGFTTDAFNEEHADFLKEFFIHRNKDHLPFAFRYLTYKPGIDILTESQQYRLCLDLLNEGYKVYCMDDAIIHLCDDRIIFEDPSEEVYWINL